MRTNASRWPPFLYSLRVPRVRLSVIRHRHSPFRSHRARRFPPSTRSQISQEQCWNWKLTDLTQYSTLVDASPSPYIIQFKFTSLPYPRSRNAHSPWDGTGQDRGSTPSHRHTITRSSFISFSWNVKVQTVCGIYWTPIVICRNFLERHSVGRLHYSFGKNVVTLSKQAFHTVFRQKTGAGKPGRSFHGKSGTPFLKRQKFSNPLSNFLVSSKKNDAMTEPIFSSKTFCHTVFI